jgi:hypothetical protein
MLSCRKKLRPEDDGSSPMTRVPRQGHRLAQDATGSLAADTDCARTPRAKSSYHAVIDKVNVRWNPIPENHQTVMACTPVAESMSRSMWRARHRARHRSRHRSMWRPRSRSTRRSMWRSTPRSPSQRSNRHGSLAGHGPEPHNASPRGISGSELTVMPRGECGAPRLYHGVSTHPCGMKTVRPATRRDTP